MSVCGTDARGVPHAAFLGPGDQPSCPWSPASSRVLEFHRAPRRDSGQVVTPLMRVGTYPTRDFATLGPLELRPPLTGASVRAHFPTNRDLSPPLNLPMLGRCRLLYRGLRLVQEPVFLLNSRPTFFSAAPDCCGGKLHDSPGRPLSRSYGALLPSSLAGVRPSALGHLSLPTSGGLRYGHPCP